jgi:hypothetical protein
MGSNCGLSAQPLRDGKLLVRQVRRSLAESDARLCSGSVDMDDAIARSIREKRRLRFDYNGKTRLAEPQCYGVGTRGTELLRVHQISGGSEREPLFDVSKIENLVVLDETFIRPGPNYKRNDSAMKTIFCQL